MASQQQIELNAKNTVSNKENIGAEVSAKAAPQSPTGTRVPLADCTEAHPGFATVNGVKSELPHRKRQVRPRGVFDQALAGVHKTVPYVSPSKRRSSPDKRLAAAYTKITHHLDFKIHEDQA